MKILELTLVNFLPILSGMGKESITLNLRNSTELINVFIGKIGSGKTYILSHLQPFSTVGTLDIRNTDDPIIEGRDGLKRIVYLKENHEYIITHEYIWTGKNHTKKSYIEKDGVELNENGNSSSFKELIQLEFGIDQSFLRLMRLGPNVINFINMKATERKSYIASLLSSTEMYLMLYKAWSQELRTLNTQASVLTNKLNSYKISSIDELQDDIDRLNEEVNSITFRIDEDTKKKYELQAINKACLGNLSYKEFRSRETELLSLIETLKTEIGDLENLMDSYKTYPDIKEVSKIIGNLDGKMSSLESLLSDLNAEYQDITTKLHGLMDKKAISNNESHMNTLKETYQDLMQQSEKYQRELRGFQCEYSSTFLSGFLGDLNLMNVLINELIQYDSDVINTIYHSDSSIISYAQKKIEVLGYRKLKVQKLMNNLKFSESYNPSSKLYFPPFCPTKSCPYYKTHPYTLQKNYSAIDEMKDQIASYQHELQELDIEIYKYSDYSIIYSKISTLKDYWKKAEPILTSIGALNCNNLKMILTNVSYQVWYNYDKIIDTIDLIEKREKYFELMEKMKVIKNEMNELELNDSESLDKEIEGLTSQIEVISSRIEKEEVYHKELVDQLKSYNQIYVDLSEKSIREDELNTKKKTLSSYSDELQNIQSNHQEIQDNLVQIHILDSRISEMSSLLNDRTSRIDRLKTKMNDIQYTNKELSHVMEEYNYMTHMVDAVSSKKGIPLVMIQIFLDSCRDTVNDMIYAVCEDDIEILPFDINETEFKIPYMVNGRKIDDISKASQGQSSIVSTCLSFALVKQVGSFVYNIPLLDEMDGALHKNDKQKFISVLLKYLTEINSEQCFVITHDGDNIFGNQHIQIISTSPEEIIDKEKYTNIIRL